MENLDEIDMQLIAKNYECTIFDISSVINLCVNHVSNSHAPTGAYLAKSLEEAISMVTDKGDLADKVEGVHIIGGSSVYKVSIE